MQLVSTNPAKEFEVVGEVEESSEAEIKAKVKDANAAKKYWRDLGVTKRIELIKPIYEEVKRRKTELATVITREIGKPITESLSDIDWDLEYFEWFLNHGEKYLAEEITHEDAKTVHKIVYEPIGVAAVITPWNLPFDMFIWGVIPNLIAGNTVVFKHSEECPLTGKLLEDIVAKAELPGGVFSEVYGDGKVGNILVNQDIDLIWFTGSSKAGRLLYQLAGQKFIKAVLEMGGSNPGVIFEDISPSEITGKLFFKRYFNCGQTCDAIKRLIVHESIYNDVIEALKSKIAEQVVGDPENVDTTIGSLVSKKQLEKLEMQVEDAIKKGAKAVIGGNKPEGLKGAYYSPTLLVDVTPDMEVWQEEVFGPVLPVISFKTEEEAITLANDTKYGLGAVVFSKDAARALRVANEIQSGVVDINHANHWLACNPFGGMKESGMGREHGRDGFRELTQVKVISIEKS